MNSRQEAHQEDDNLNQEYKQELDRMAKDAYRETQRYIAKLQSIFDIPEEKSQISQDLDMLDGSVWEYRTSSTLHVTDDHFESFHAQVKQKLDRHLNEYEGILTLDQVGTYSVSSQHDQRKIMKSDGELIKLLQTETTHIVTNEQSLKQAKTILKTSSRRSDPVDD